VVGDAEGALVDTEQLKRQAALAALTWVPEGEVLGVGTGSTAAHFIDALDASGLHVPRAVASSQETADHLARIGVDVVDLSAVGRVAVYIDGADEIDPRLRLIKGGGGALTREKICAEAAETFVCIADESKVVARLGEFPLAVEIIPMARRLVAERLAELGGRPTERQGYSTDNGNPVLDVTGLSFDEPERLEQIIDSYPGVVASGLFARRRADVALVAGESGVTETRAIESG
jgi:ribose 5-phosphate isomerase A